jgi:hypothetical protein
VRGLLLLIILLMIVPSLRAQSVSGEAAGAEIGPAITPQITPQITQWPLLELPFNTETPYAWPSMQQSLQLSSSFYQTTHTLLKRSFESRHMPELNEKITIIGFDLLSSYLPLGNSWMHEEWHRAVMTHRQIQSQNDVYKMRLFGDLISVSHVEDEDLIRLKKDFPADQVRLSEAGMEAQTEQNLYLEKAQFFDHSPSWDAVILWSNAIGNWGYIHSCNDSGSTQQTKDLNQQDGSDVSARDFTGLDCLGWVYDLYRPDEPYQNRGPHPSGVGIDRYRRLDQLTDDERYFLKKQEWLSALTLVDPFLLGFRRFQTEVGGEPLEWNAKLQHFLTSFGYDVDLVLFLTFRDTHFLVKSHQFFNTKKYFPGLSLELYKWPLGRKFLVSPGVSLWEQPLDQRFDATNGAVGGAFDMTLSYLASESIQPYIYTSVKDRGWKAGDVELGRGFLVGTGLSVVF